TVIELFSLTAEGIAAIYQQVQTAFSLPDLTAWDGGLFGGDATLQTGSVLGTAIVKLAFLGFWIYLNIIYVVRKLVLTGLLCAFPFLIVAWSVNGNVPALTIWLGEVGSNAIMPVAHALMLCFILGITDVSKAAEGSWLTALVAIYTFFPLTEMLRNSYQSLFARWAGVNEAGIAGGVLGSVLGVGGLLRVGRAAFAGTGPPLPKTVSVASTTGSGSPGEPGSGGYGGPSAGAPAPVFTPAWSGGPGGPALARSNVATGGYAPSVYGGRGVGGNGYSPGYVSGDGEPEPTRRPIGFRPPGQEEQASPGESRRQGRQVPTSLINPPAGKPGSQLHASDSQAQPTPAQQAWRVAATVASAGAAVATAAAFGATPGLANYARPAARAVWSLGQKAAQYGVVGPYSLSGGFRP
ncbi:MAG: hypothetical protein ACOY81_12100, partial [Bacillota bacterium]